jgi:hypothetical protein
MRLEREFWDALEEIAGRHATSIGVLCTRIADGRAGRSLSSAVRVEVLAYYRRCFAAIDQAATIIRDPPRPKSDGARSRLSRQYPRLATDQDDPRESHAT